MTTLAIDIGGTKIAAAVCDENDAITHRWRVPTPMDADAMAGIDRITGFHRFERHVG